MGDRRLLPEVGAVARMGQAAEHGAELAVQEANSGKLVAGVTFSLVAKGDTDPAGTPTGTTGAAQIKGPPVGRRSGSSRPLRRHRPRR